MNRSHALVPIGAALVVGFFLPWISFGWLEGISGWDLVWHGHGEYLSRLALLGCPLLGVALVLAGLNRSRAATGMGALAGVGILGYTVVKFAWGLLMGTGLGLWLVLGGAVAALAVGMRGAKKLPDEDL